MLGKRPWLLPALVSGVAWVPAIWPKLRQWQCWQLKSVEDLVKKLSWDLSPISIVMPWVSSLRWTELLWHYWPACNGCDGIQFTRRPPDAGWWDRGWCDSGAELHSRSLVSWIQTKSLYKTHHPHLSHWKSIFFSTLTAYGPLLSLISAPHNLPPYLGWPSRPLEKQQTQHRWSSWLDIHQDHSRSGTQPCREILNQLLRIRLEILIFIVISWQRRQC